MRKTQKVLIFFLMVTAIVLSSCKSTPKAVQNDKPKPNTAAAQAEKERLLAEIAKIEGENGKLQKAREKAVSLEADTAYPQQFTAADELAEKAKADAAGGNLKEALAKYNEAINRYDTLSGLMEVAAMRKEIEEHKFEKYNPEAYSKANGLWENTTQELENSSPNYKTVRENSEKTAELYKTILNAGYYDLTKAAQAAARAAKEKCDSIKVARSRTEEYNKAVLTYNTGKVHASENNYREAYMSYKNSGEAFSLLYGEVSVKRREAAKAISDAGKKQQQSAKLAREADKEAPLTKAGEGFGSGELELENKTTPMAGEKIEEIVPDTENGAERKPGSDGNAAKDGSAGV